MPNNPNALDALLDALQALAPQSPDATATSAHVKDAIDRVLDADPRQTAVQSLRDDPVIEKFRQDLTDGLIRIDTANVLLRLVTDVLHLYRGMP